MPPSALHDAAEIAYNDMLEQIDPRNLALRGKTALFENFGTAMLVLAVVAGGLLLGVLYYYCMTTLTLGRKAWRGHTIYEGTSLRQVWMRMQDGSTRHATVAHPQFREETRSSRSSWAHLVAIIGYWAIVLFGIYSAFQVCGIDPAILIALGAGTLLFSYGLAPLISNTRDAIRVFWQNRFREGDMIFVWAARVKGRVNWMGSDYVELEEINDDGEYIEHQLSYSTIITPGFSRWVTGGEGHVMGKAFKEWADVRQGNFGAVASHANPGQNAMHHAHSANRAASHAGVLPTGQYLSNVMHQKDN